MLVVVLLIMINFEFIVEKFKKIVRIQFKNNFVVYVLIGIEDMDDEKFVENVEVVFNVIINKFECGENQVKLVYIKIIMGLVVKVER